MKPFMSSLYCITSLHPLTSEQRHFHQAASSDGSRVQRSPQHKRLEGQRRPPRAHHRQWERQRLLPSPHHKLLEGPSHLASSKGVLSLKHRHPHGVRPRQHHWCTSTQEMSSTWWVQQQCPRNHLPLGTSALEHHHLRGYKCRGLAQCSGPFQKSLRSKHTNIPTYQKCKDEMVHLGMWT